jgi:hypothetical protein
MVRRDSKYDCEILTTPPPSHITDGDSEYYNRETLTYSWFSWLGGGTQNVMAAKY